MTTDAKRDTRIYLVRPKAGITPKHIAAVEHYIESVAHALEGVDGTAAAAKLLKKGDELREVMRGGAARLVRASRVTLALRHVASDTYEAIVPTQDQLLAAAAAGAKVEDAAS